jgi:hypothetical protein
MDGAAGPGGTAGRGSADGGGKGGEGGIGGKGPIGRRRGGGARGRLGGVAVLRRHYRGGRGAGAPFFAGASSGRRRQREGSGREPGWNGTVLRDADR